MNFPVPSDRARPWTCPFCPLLCDGFSIDAESASEPTLVGSDCPRARAALACLGRADLQRQPLLDGAACEPAAAIAKAARLLATSRQPLFAGLGTDVAGARALYRLACETGAICDAAQGEALMQGLRALQDRGAFTTTLAEVRERADLIVCLGGSPAQSFPEFFRRCGIGERRDDGAVLARRLVLIDAAGEGGSAALPALPEVAVESIGLRGDLHEGVNTLAALVAGRHVPEAPAPLAALARRLLESRYAVIVWQGGRLPAHGALLVEAVQRIVNTLNQSTRAAALPLGGADGAATVNQVFAWLSGLPLRSRAGPAGLEHEPLVFDTSRLLARRSVDCLLWVQSFNADAAPPATDLPCIVLGHPAMTLPAVTPRGSVFIPVSTPGLGAAGHLFRADGVVLLPLHAVRPDGLPGVAEVVTSLSTALLALRPEAA